MNFDDLKAYTAAEAGAGTPFLDACQALERRIFAASRDATIELLTDIGAIPESIDHDSTEEKLYSKATELVLAKALQELGLRANIASKRADCADVFARSDFHDYSLVADAKSFRLSRTAKNQKDFKVDSLSSWRCDSDYAVLVCPYYQYPRSASQIYGQALDKNVCLLSWEHLGLFLRSGIRENQSLNLAAIWGLSKNLGARVTISEKALASKFSGARKRPHL